MSLKNLFVIPAVLGIALAAGACSEHSLDLWQNSHRAEGPGFGDNHRQLMAKHIVDPEPAKPTESDAAMEAQGLSKGITDYLKGPSEGGGAGGGGKGGAGVKASVR